MDEMKLELPWIGSPEAAVAGIESLIFHAIGGEKVCPPTRLRYWLEAYYQARKTADAVRGTPQEIQVDQFGFEKEDDGAAVSAPPEQAGESDGQEDTSSVTAEAVTPSPQGEDQSEPKAKIRPVGWTEETEQPKAGAAQAAAYKRAVRERFLHLRSEGLHLSQVKKYGEGNISDDQILAILEGRKVSVAAYKILDAVLDRIEMS